MSSTPPDFALPDYVTPLQSRVPLLVAPPFSFEGMTARVFPLRARLYSLQRFCDQYLNIIPPELGYFRAPVPFVYLMVLDYGRMAIDIGNQGWLAQREIAFIVPLEWYRRVGGRWVFHDWATIAPFIFVDSDSSMAIGRGVYGWPKTIARVKGGESAWIHDPFAPELEASVSTMVFPGLFQGRRLEDHTFLEIGRAATTSAFRVPPDPRIAIAPWTVASHFAEAAVGLGRDYLGLLAGLGIWPPGPSSEPYNSRARMEQLARWASPMGPNQAANTLNLKQVRSAEQPWLYAFQALTNGPIRLTAFNRGGLLGEQRMALGDVSGGFQVRIHRWPSLPIVDTLGLEPARSWEGPGCQVAELKPVFPFWLDVNAEYLPGYNIAWRTEEDATWRDAGGQAYSASPTPGGAPADRLFNTILGASNTAMVGPFSFTGTTIRVLPLLAERCKLEKLLCKYLNDPLTDSSPGQKFTLWADPDSEYAYVYMTATVYGEVTSDTNNLGNWANGEVAFLVPVIRSADAARSTEMCGVGLVPAFVYVDGAIAAATGAEVEGIPTVRANFVRPESAWMTAVPPGQERKRSLLRVQAEVLPAVGEGQRTETRTLIEIVAGESNEAAEDPEEERKWRRMLEEEWIRKLGRAGNPGEYLDIGQALVLELTGGRQPTVLYTLKQVRDIADPNNACYQSLVRVNRKLQVRRWLDLREIEDKLTVRIQESNSHPLVRSLGLVGVRVKSDGLGAAYRLEPIRPFWINLSFTEELGHELVTRSRLGRWGRIGPTVAAGATDLLDSVLCGEWNLTVSELLRELVDMGDPRPLERWVENWKEWLRADGTGALAATAEDGRTKQSVIRAAHAKEALSLIDPQMIVERILSREWGNFDRNARWRARRREMKVQLEARQIGMQDWETRAGVEQSYFEDQLEALHGEEDGRSSQTAKVKDLGHDILRNLGAFNELLGPMEAMWAKRSFEAEFAETFAVPPMMNVEQLFESLRKIGTKEVMGAPLSLAALHRNSLAFQRLLDQEEFPNPSKAIEAFLRLARERVALQRDALLNLLSKAAQKPDFPRPGDSPPTFTSTVSPPAGPSRVRAL